MRNRLAILSTALVLVACASVAAGEPWSVIDGTDYDRSDPHAVPVEIAAIDGKSFIDLHHRSLPPGKHTVRFLTTLTLRVPRIRETREVELDLKPCTAYYFYAQHPSRLDPKWELKLLREVELKACTK